MKTEEAISILKIMKTADGGCQYCVHCLFYRFMKNFPQFRSEAEKIYFEEFGVDFN